MFGVARSQVKPSLGFQFVALPVDLLRRPDLSASAKLLAAVVMDAARGARSGLCKLSNAALGARIGRSAASVKRLLAELEAAGLVRRDHAAEKHQRTAIVPTWVDQSRAAEQAHADREQPGGGAETSRGAAQSRATPQSAPSETISQTVPPLSTRGEKPPAPGPGEVAAAVRAMISGSWRPTTAEPAAPRRLPASSDGGPDLRAAFGRVGFSARAALSLGRPPRRTAAEQLADLARWSATRVASSPSPALASG
jgi:hypothetical protein